MSTERATPNHPTWPELAAPHMARYLFAGDFVGDKQVLDAGCGNGYGSLLLAAAGAREVLGIDIDADTIASAAERYNHPRLSFAVDDCERFSTTGGPWDVICSFENIEHLQRPEQFLAEAAQHLADDGVLLVSTPDRADTPPFVAGRPDNKYHVNEWYRDEYQRLLAPYFDEIELRVQVRSAALSSRQDALLALRQGLMWSNPLGTWLWRKFGRTPARGRSWRELDGLAAPSVGDYPITTPALAPLLGASAFHVAVCRGPRVAHARRRRSGTGIARALATSER